MKPFEENLSYFLCPLCEKPKFRIIVQGAVKESFEKNILKTHLMCDNCGMLMKLSAMTAYKMELESPIELKAIQ